MKKILALFILLVLFPIIALAQEPYSISFLISKKSTAKLTDKRINTYLAFAEQEQITINCIGKKAIMLKWYEPAVYSIKFYDADGVCFAQTNYNNLIVNQYVDLLDAAKIIICLPNGAKLSEIKAYEQEQISESVQIWEKPYSKADMLVISAHADDEYLYMGGTIPYYGAEKGLQVSVAWISKQKRNRQEEALTALWAMGIKHYPEFHNFVIPIKYNKNTKIKGGEEAVLSAIVRLYRKYKPEVVVTHDLKGEYGHGSHKVTAKMALEAVTVAADETKFVESAQEYGTWQVKKLYLHLYGKNKIVMDWKKPLEVFGGKTALDMAKLGYSYHKSQHIWNFKVSVTSKYSCAKFGLAYTTVGNDVEKNCFLENIPETCLSNYVPPEPLPAPQEQQTKEPAVVQPSSLAPAILPQSTPAAKQENTTQTQPPVIICIAIVTAFAFLVVFFIKRKK